jgi:hypothetical protein
LKTVLRHVSNKPIIIKDTLIINDSFNSKAKITDKRKIKKVKELQKRGESILIREEDFKKTNWKRIDSRVIRTPLWNRWRCPAFSCISINLKQNIRCMATGWG